MELFLLPMFGITNNLTLNNLNFNFNFTFKTSPIDPPSCLFALFELVIYLTIPSQPLQASY